MRQECLVAERNNYSPGIAAKETVESTETSEPPAGIVERFMKAFMKAFTSGAPN